MLPCSTSPAVVPAAAATAAAAAVTEAGAVVCLLPTVKESNTPGTRDETELQGKKERRRREERGERGKQGVEGGERVGWHLESRVKGKGGEGKA